MFDFAEDFFVTIGLYPMTESFNTNTMNIKEENSLPECHASAWDFMSTGSNIIENGDFR